MNNMIKKVGHELFLFYFFVNKCIGRFGVKIYGVYGEWYPKIKSEHFSWIDETD